MSSKFITTLQNKLISLHYDLAQLVMCASRRIGAWWRLGSHALLIQFVRLHFNMPFKAGNKANPAGPKPGRKQRMLAQLLSGSDVDEAIQVLRDCLKSPDYKLQAAREILDRVYGKPTQAVNTEVSGSINLVATIKDK